MRRRSVRHAAIIVGAFALSMLAPQLLEVRGAGIPTPLQILAAVLIAVLALAYGRSLARLFDLPPSSDLRTSFEVVAGFAASSLVHLLATATLGLSAIGALPIDLALAGILLVVSRRASRGTADGRSSPVPNLTSSPAVDAVLFLGIAAIAGLWTRAAVTAVHDAGVTGVFGAWQDFFLHAAEITYLRDYPVFHGQSLYLAGSPQPVYHRASYAMPALYSALGGMPALETATAFWMPLGLTLCGLASYGFGAAAAGRAGGIAAVLAMLLLPDASMYGLRNGFCSFHWLMQIAPGSGFAVAITLVALAAFVVGARGDRPRLIGGSVILAASALAFRVHVAILGTTLLAALALIVWRPATHWRKPAVVCVVTLVAVVAAVGLEQIALAPHFLTGRPRPVAFFDVVHRQAPDHGALFASLAGNHGPIVRVAVGYFLMLVACFGAVLPAALVLSLTHGPRRLDWRVALIPFVLVPAYLVVILAMPTPAHGDYTDYGHRPFVLVYAVLAAVMGAAIGRQCSTSVRTARGRVTLALAIVAALGCVVPWIYGRDIQERWGRQFASRPMPADAIGAARYVASHSRQGDIILASREDPFAMFVALAERPAYVSRTTLYRTLGRALGQLAASRSAQHASLGGVSTFEQLREFCRKRRIDWYLLESDDMPAWPETLKSRCSYCGPEFRVYDLR